MRTYTPRSAYAEGVYGKDDVELDLPPVEEADLVNGGHLELKPVSYRVVSDNYVGPSGDLKRDDTFEAALLLQAEASLVDAGHIERVEEKKPAKKAAKKTTKN